MSEITAFIIQAEDGTWTAVAEQISGAVSQGGTKESAMENLQDAVKMLLDYRRDQLEASFSGEFSRESFSVELA